MIKQISQLEHVLLRPSMYIGSTNFEKTQSWIIQDETFTFAQVDLNAGLIKIVDEIIDNSLDAYTAQGPGTKGKISVQTGSDNSGFYVQVQDYGTGIPNTKTKNLDGVEMYQAQLAFTELLAGSNYEQEDSTKIGTNGLGQKLSNIFSTKSVILNDDGKIRVKISTKDNMKEVQVQELKSNKSGVQTKIYPDFERFGTTPEEGLNHILEVTKARLNKLSLAFSNITFVLNKDIIRTSSKKYFDQFKCSVKSEGTNFEIGIGKSETGTLEQLSIINGLSLKGGSLQELILYEIVSRIQAKLTKKKEFKSLNPADIRNNLRLVIVGNNYENMTYKSQTKEEISNATEDNRKFLDSFDFDSLASRIMRSDILDQVKEMFQLKAKASENLELKKLKKLKVQKSDKLTPAVGVMKRLVVVEGLSALSGIMPALGREGNAFYALRGKLPNVRKNPEFLKTNVEMRELYAILNNSDAELIVANDSDLDGFHIGALIQNFVDFCELKCTVKTLQTPVRIVKMNDKVVRWSYDLNDDLDVKSGETLKYVKGLGSNSPKDLRAIWDAEPEMKYRTIDMSTNELNKWFNEEVQFRKDKILDNEFSISSI